MLSGTVDLAVCSYGAIWFTIGESPDSPLASLSPQRFRSKSFLLEKIFHYHLSDLAEDD